MGGVPVIALAYHVDYWNYLGWRDPFSAKQWTTRQRAYASAVAGGRVYTPQLIINGRGHAVGSQRRQVAAKVRALASTSAINLQASLTRKAGRVRVVVRVPRAVRRSGVELTVALYENDIRTRVPRGENAGRSLRNDHIVRALKRGPAKAKREFTFTVRPGWVAKNLGAVAFLRDAKTLAVLATVRAKTR